MTARRGFVAAFRNRRGDPTASPEAATDTAAGIDPSAVQVLAHGLIADLFGAGLRLQGLAARAPQEMQAELEQIADQMDKTIRDLRDFAFSNRPPRN